MGNSQFQQLKATVKALSAEVKQLRENQGSNADVAAQKVLVKQSKQQQQVAKHVLLDPQSTADELEEAAPFLPSRGLQEQAKLDARSKRAAEEMLKPSFVLTRTDLIDGMKNAYSTGEYQQWRQSMARPNDSTFTTGKRLPNGRTMPSQSAMRAAQQLSERSYVSNQRSLEKPVPLKPQAKQQENTSIPLSRFFKN